MAIFFTILLASITQGITGFGFALIAIPLLSIFIPEMKSITPIVVIYSLLANLFITYKARKVIQIKKVIPLIIFGILGTPIGVYILIAVSVNKLRIIIGIIIVITAFAMLRNYKFKIKNEKISYGIVGILSGILNGSAGLSGPPVVLFLTNQGIDKEAFRANLTIYGLATNIFAIISFFASGLMNLTALRFIAIYIPALILGVFLGVKTASKLSEPLFRKFTIYLIIVLGTYTVISSIFN